MRKPILKISIIFFVIMIIITGIFLVLKYRNNPVETKEEAIKIAKEYVLEKYDNSFPEYVIECNQEKNNWVVFYTRPPKKENDKLIVMFGGGPELKIDKETGKVVYCKLQK